MKTESNTNQFVAGAVVAVLARLGAIGRKLFGQNVNFRPGSRPFVASEEDSAPPGVTK